MSLLRDIHFSVRQPQAQHVREPERAFSLPCDCDDGISECYCLSMPERLFDPAPARCTYCSALVPEDTENLQAHHNTYERVGRELETDLVPLCLTCHQRHHGKRP